VVCQAFRLDVGCNRVIAAHGETVPDYIPAIFLRGPFVCDDLFLRGTIVHHDYIRRDEEYDRHVKT
jgi:hypothetical protein